MGWAVDAAVESVAAAVARATSVQPINLHQDNKDGELCQVEMEQDRWEWGQ